MTDSVSLLLCYCFFFSFSKEKNNGGQREGGVVDVLRMSNLHGEHAEKACANQGVSPTLPTAMIAPSCLYFDFIIIIFSLGLTSLLPT